MPNIVGKGVGKQFLLYMSEVSRSLESFSNLAIPGIYPSETRNMQYYFGARFLATFLALFLLWRHLRLARWLSVKASALRLST